jgi:hypothetical protein
MGRRSSITFGKPLPHTPHPRHIHRIRLEAIHPDSQIKFYCAAVPCFGRCLILCNLRFWHEADYSRSHWSAYLRIADMAEYHSMQPTSTSP